MTFPRPLLALWRSAALLCALGLANVSLGQTAAPWGWQGLSLTLTQTTYWEQDGTPHTDLEVQAPSGDDSLGITLYASNDLTANGFDDDGAGGGSWAGANDPQSARLRAGTATVTVTGPGSTVSSFMVSTGTGDCDTAMSVNADRVTITGCTWPENGHVPTTLGVGVYEHTVSAASSAGANIVFDSDSRQASGSFRFNRVTNPTPVTLTIFPRYGAVSNVTQALSLAQTEFTTEGGTTTVTLDVGFDYTEDGPATRASALGIDIEEVWWELVDPAGALVPMSGGFELSVTCNEAISNPGTADTESASCADETELAIPAGLAVGSYTVRVASASRASAQGVDHRIGLSVNGVPYRSSEGADPSVAPSADPVVISVSEPPATTVTWTNPEQADDGLTATLAQTTYWEHDGTRFADLDVQAPTRGNPLGVTLRVNNDLTVNGYDDGAGAGIHRGLAGTQRASLRAGTATIGVTGPGSATSSFTVDTGGDCDSVEAATADRFVATGCTWPENGHVPTTLGVGIYEHVVSSVSSNAGVTFSTSSNAGTGGGRAALDRITGPTPATLTVSPRHGAVSNVTQELRAWPQRFTRRGGTITVSLVVGFDYTESGPATRARTLEADVRDVSVVLVDGSGTEHASVSLDGTCGRPVTNARTADTESVSCAVVGELTIPSNTLPTRTAMLSVAAGTATEDSHGIGLLVNGVPYRSAAAADPFVAPPADSVLLDIASGAHFGGNRLTVYHGLSAGQGGQTLADLGAQAPTGDSSATVTLQGRTAVNFVETAGSNYTSLFVGMVSLTGTATVVETKGTSTVATDIRIPVTSAVFLDDPVSVGVNMLTVCDESTISEEGWSVFDAACRWPRGGVERAIPQPRIGDVHTYSLTSFPPMPAGTPVLIFRTAGVPGHHQDLTSRPDIADARPATVTIVPRHDSITDVRQTLGDLGRATFFTDETPTVSLTVGIDYTEAGPATQAETLGIDIQDVTVALVDDGGTERWTATLAQTCAETDVSPGTADTESASCVAETALEHLDLPAGSYTLTVPAAAGEPDTHRVAFSINGVPHRASATADPFVTPAVGESIAIDFVENTAPTVRMSPRAFAVGSSVAFTPSPVVTGGNGSVTVGYSISGVPAGMEFDPASGRLTGTPTAPGTHTLTVTATDSDSRIIPSQPDETDEAEVEIRVVDGTAMLPVVSFQDPVCPAIEGRGAATVSLSLPVPAAEEHTVPVRVVTTGAAAEASPGDYVVGSANAVFAMGETTATVLVNASDDAERDPGEQVRLGLGLLPDGLYAGSASVAIVDLVDNLVTVGMTGPAEVGEADGNATLTLTAAGDAIDRKFSRCAALGTPGADGTIPTSALRVFPSADLDVTIEFDPASSATGATDGSGDYETPMLEQTISMGVATATFTVAINDDTAEEWPHEFFRVSATAESDGSPGTRATIDSAAAEVTITIVDNDGPSVSFDIAGETASDGSFRLTVNEGEAVTVSVVLDRQSTRTLVVPVGVTGDGTPTMDYSGVLERVTFTRNEQTVSFTVQAEIDGESDDGETLALRLTRTDGTGAGATVAGLPPGTFPGTPDEIDLVVRDRPLSLSTVPANLTLDEAEDFGPGEFTVRAEVDMTAASPQAVTLSLVPGGTATPGVDIVAGVSTLTISTGETSVIAAFPFVLLADGASEEPETFRVGGEAVDLRVGTVDVAITDGDDGLISLEITHVGEDDPIREGSPAEFEVTLGGDTGAGVSVPWALSAAGDADGNDVETASGEIVFPVSAFPVGPDIEERTQVFRVDIPDDDVAEPAEALVIRLGDPVVDGNPAMEPAAMFGEREATVGIAASDTVTLSLTAPTAATEGTDATHTLAAVGGGARAAPMTFDVSVTPGAFTAPSPVTLPPTEDSVTFDVSSPDDADTSDSAFTVEVSQSAPGAGTAALPATLLASRATVQVRDDDATVTVSFGQASGTAVERGAAATLDVRLDRAVGRTVSVPLTVTVSGGATASDHSGIPGSVVFDPGETSRALTVTAVGDTDAETGETVGLEFGTLPSMATAGTPAAATVTLADAGVVLSVSPVTLTEGTHHSMTITVERGAPQAEELVVTVRVVDENGASASSDFFLHGGGIFLHDGGLPVTIPANAASVSSTAIELQDDDLVEPDEEFAVTGFSASVPGILPATVIVTDDAGEQASVSISGPLPVAEGGELRFEVALTPVSGEVSVPWRALGDGVSPGDIHPMTGTVTFPGAPSPPTGRTLPIVINVLEDRLSEGAETVTVNLGTPVGLGGRVTLGTTTATGVVAASDPLELSLSGPERALEGSSPAYRVALSGGVGSEDISVDVTVESAVATEGDDYVPPTSPLVIPSGETSGTFTVGMTDDATDEADEEITVGISNARSDGGAVSVAAADATVSSTIVDNDLEVSFESGSLELTEGDSAAMVTVTLGRVPGRAVTLPIRVVPNGVGASAEDDLDVQPPASIMFAADATMATFPVSVSIDRPNDDGETFELVLDTASSPLLTDGAIPTLTLTVADHHGGSANTDPVFDPPRADTITIMVTENLVPGNPIGEPFSATDTDAGDRPIYSLSGVHASLFAISDNGVLALARGVRLDHESGVTVLDLTVEVRDGLDSASTPDTVVDASIAVVVEVADVMEPPLTPPPPSYQVRSGSDGAATLAISWEAPLNNGPAVVGYDVQYREAGAGDWVTVSLTSAATRASVPGLDPGATYEVRVRARSADGAGPWSDITDGETEGGADLDADGNGVVEARDGLFLFYTFQFGGILGRDTGLRDIVFDNLASRAMPPTRTNAEILEYARLLATP